MDARHTRSGTEEGDPGRDRVRSRAAGWALGASGGRERPRRGARPRERQKRSPSRPPGGGEEGGHRAAGLRGPDSKVRVRELPGDSATGRCGHRTGKGATFASHVRGQETFRRHSGRATGYGQRAVCACVRVFVCICVHEHVCVHMHMSVCMSVWCARARVCACVYVCVCMYGLGRNARNLMSPPKAKRMGNMLRTVSWGRGRGEEGGRGIGRTGAETEHRYYGNTQNGLVPMGTSTLTISARTRRLPVISVAARVQSRSMTCPRSRDYRTQIMLLRCLSLCLSQERSGEQGSDKVSLHERRPFS